MFPFGNIIIFYIYSTIFYHFSLNQFMFFQHIFNSDAPALSKPGKIFYVKNHFAFFLLYTFTQIDFFL